VTPPNKILTLGTFYTYLWLREDGTPFYVGKGKWKAQQQRAFRNGAPSPDRIIIEAHPSEDDALFAEVFLISYYGRKDNGTGCLRNRTNGGEGLSGTAFTKQHRERIAHSLSVSKKGKPIPHYDPVEHGKKINGPKNFWYGKKRTFNAEWCKRLSLGKIGHVKAEETKRKIGAGIKKHSQEHPRTHCRRGHSYEGLNLKINKSGYKICLTCSRETNRIASQKRRDRKKARAECHFSE
jgi:hypothetical protein